MPRGASSNVYLQGTWSGDPYSNPLNYAGGTDPNYKGPIPGGPGWDQYVASQSAGMPPPPQSPSPSPSSPSPLPSYFPIGQPPLPNTQAQTPTPQTSAMQRFNQFTGGGPVANAPQSPFSVQANMLHSSYYSPLPQYNMNFST